MHALPARLPGVLDPPTYRPTVPPTDLVLISLFAGVEGIGLAAEQVGIRPVAAVEIDPAARGVIADRMPDTALYEDVTAVHARAYCPHKERCANCLPDVDPGRLVLSAGFPCQDLSVAGRRRGMGEGTRSGLYWHVDRLLVELAPAWVVLENVPGLLSATCPCRGDGSCVAGGRSVRCAGELHPVPGGACRGGCVASHGGAMGAVLGSVGHRGYGFAYRVLDAQHFGVPQRRRRVVVVGHLGDPAGPVEVLLEPEGGVGDPAPGLTAGPGAAADVDGGAAGGGVEGVDVYNGELTGEVAHTVRGGHDQGVPRVITSGDDLDPAPSRPVDGRRALVAATGETTAALTAHSHLVDDNTAQAGQLVVGALTASGGGADENDAAEGRLLPFEVVSTLQAAGGDRGYRIDAEAAAGGHLIPVEDEHEQHAFSDARAYGGYEPGAGTLMASDYKRPESHVVAHFRKSTRAASAEHDETWVPDEVASTLNTFDVGDTRATSVIVQPLLEVGARTGSSTDDPRAGIGIGDEGDPMFTLQASKQHGVAVHPLAIRGRDDGAQLEVGPEDGPYNALRAGDGGSSRQSLVAITTPEVAATLTAGQSAPGVSAPGRRQEDDHNLVAVSGVMGEQSHTLTASASKTVTEDGTGRGVPVVSLTGERTHALTSEGADASEDGTGRGTPLAATATAVRRLTPVECERLQGFPDGHTATSNGKVQSDSARYKQMGNAVAVPVFRWTLGRLVAVDARRRP